MAPLFRVTEDDMSNVVQQNDSPNARSTKFLQRFYLQRLRRLVATRQEHGINLTSGSSELRLLDRAVYSTFCDCLDLGSGEDARAVLRGEQIPSRGPKS